MCPLTSHHCQNNIPQISYRYLEMLIVFQNSFLIPWMRSLRLGATFGEKVGLCENWRGIMTGTTMTPFVPLWRSFLSHPFSPQPVRATWRITRSRSGNFLRGFSSDSPFSPHIHSPPSPLLQPVGEFRDISRQSVVVHFPRNRVINPRILFLLCCWPPTKKWAFLLLLPPSFPLLSFQYIKLLALPPSRVYDINFSPSTARLYCCSL